MRPATAEDDPGVLELLGRALGWSGDDRFTEFFRWKHRQNPFGPSPAWVAVAGGQVVGFRAFLRWEMELEGSPVVAVRAVDTATDPSRQRQGIFTRLTRHALDRLGAEGADFVFNTPNERSRPGYLKMGWQDVGRVPVALRPRSPVTVPRLAGARAPAERWSMPTDAGSPAGEVLADRGRTSALLESQPVAAGLRTRRSPEFLAWRYGFEPLRYRAVAAGGTLDDGFALFRLRRRGPAVEAAVSDVLVAGGDRRLAASALRRVASTPGCDYAIAIGAPGSLLAGFLPAPRQGPLLVWRGLARPARPAGRWELSLGDVELF